MNEHCELFEKVVATSGLAAHIGPGMVQRALTAAGVLFVGQARPADYKRALPQLRARMAIYLPPAEVDRRVREIEALLAKV